MIVARSSFYGSVYAPRENFGNMSQLLLFDRSTTHKIFFKILCLNFVKGEYLVHFDGYF